MTDSFVHYFFRPTYSLIPRSDTHLSGNGSSEGGSQYEGASELLQSVLLRASNHKWQQET